MELPTPTFKLIEEATLTLTRIKYKTRKSLIKHCSPRNLLHFPCLFTIFCFVIMLNPVSSVMFI